MLELDPNSERDRLVILYGNMRIWGEAAKTQWHRIADPESGQTQRHIDAAFFAIALLRFEEAVRRAVKELDSSGLQKSFAEYKKVASDTKTVRHVLHYILDYSLGEGDLQKKFVDRPAEEWQVLYEKSENDFLVRVGPHYRLSVAQTARATDGVVDVAWEWSMDVPSNSRLQLTPIASRRGAAEPPCR